MWYAMFLCISTLFIVTVLNQQIDMKIKGINLGGGGGGGGGNC